MLLLINTYVLMVSRDNIFSSKVSFAKNQAALIATYLEEAFVSLSVDDEERITAIVSQIEITSGSHIVITDGTGNVVYDPSDISGSEDFPYHRIEEALLGNDVFYAEFSAGAFTASAFIPVINRGAIIGLVYFTETDADQGSLLLEMQNTFMNISIGVAVAAVVAITLIIISVMGRVNSIINAVKSVREGEYSYTIGMSGHDELALLSDEFNSLTGRLRETDEVRRRFVADASHELKTPLTTIRLLTDSILQNPDIDTKTVMEFISDINMEAERLAGTTDRLMTLTRLDSNTDEKMIRVNMKDEVKETVRMLKPLAQNIGVSIRTQLSEGCYIRAAEDSVHHIIFNLIENAIKYNKENGNVFVRLDVVDDTVIFAVKDRGIGVPEDDLPYIFDRFYRVDKARSRGAATGGSGLGLAIVKDTVRQLGGTVRAERRKSGGMVFTVEFPLFA